MQTDPRRILSAVQDVSTTLGQWTMGSIQVGQDISQAQAQASESSSTSRTRSNQVFNQAFDLETQLGERLDQAEESLLKAKDQLKQTEEVANRANELTRICEAETAKWSDQLAQATQWAAQLQMRLHAADAQVQQLNAALQQINYQVSAAADALRRCQADPEMTNCSGSANQLQNAQMAATKAEQALVAAQGEARDLRANLALAVARVDCCRDAVSTCNNASSKGEVALQQTSEASKQVTLGVDSVRVGRDRMEEARGTARDALAPAGDAVRCSRNAESQAAVGQQALARVMAAQQSAVALSTNAQHDLERRSDALRNFDTEAHVS